ncbi:MAG: Zn-dependent hydrolase [Deltaproteobacteria bacterium]|nr:Zn-dependent hydrolase [Deltaproteobacteria bacterium]
MDTSAIKVKEDRLRKDLLDLARFGEEPDGGIMRTALSDADLEARRWFQARMREAGLRVHEDAAANIIGRLDPAAGPTDAPCIAVGSHIDAVPHGGRFDGALGICAGLEAIRAIRESGLPIPSPLELLVFTDEEGRHFAGTFGSRAMFNLLIEGEIHRSKGTGKPSMAHSLERMGKDPGRIGEAARSPSEFRAYLELHIEQGPVLESVGAPIGIVEGIVDISRYFIRTKGESGHAGTTPMHMRDDALVKAARIITAVNDAVILAGPDIVGTIGELKVEPGAFNIIPGSVQMSLEIRSMKKAAVQSLHETIQEIVRSVDNARLEPILSKGGVVMDPTIMDTIELSCHEQGIHFHRMGSGAGHDAMTFPPLGIPTGMIFIPCVNGKSHCPDEEIRWEDAAVGAQILADTVIRIASQQMQFNKTR